MKRDSSWFEGVEPQLVFIAKKLRHAKALEETFDEAQVDYGVEADHYVGGFIFRTTRVGAFFYVRPEEKDRAEAVMLAHGFVPAREDWTG